MCKIQKNNGHGRDRCLCKFKGKALLSGTSQAHHDSAVRSNGAGCSSKFQPTATCLSGMGSTEISLHWRSSQKMAGVYTVYAKNDSRHTKVTRADILHYDLPPPNVKNLYVFVCLHPTRTAISALVSQHSFPSIPPLYPFTPTGVDMWRRPSTRCLYASMQVSQP